MNAKKITALLVVSIVISLSTIANNPVTATYSNVENTINGTIKEYTLFRLDTNEPTKKSVYKYDIDGNVQERIIYLWKGKDKGWKENEKLTYVYGEDKSTPVSLSLTQWDNKTKDWSSKSQTMDYSNIK